MQQRSNTEEINFAAILYHDQIYDTPYGSMYKAHK
jgi:hypothetical protein